MWKAVWRSRPMVLEASRPCLLSGSAKIGLKVVWWKSTCESPFVAAVPRVRFESLVLSRLFCCDFCLQSQF